MRSAADLFIPCARTINGRGRFATGRRETLPISVLWLSNGIALFFFSGYSVMGRSTYERMAASDSIWLPRNSQTIHWSDKVHVDTFCMASEKQQYIKKPGISLQHKKAMNFENILLQFGISNSSLQSHQSHNHC